MKLILEKGELSLPEGFAFELESNNPFFSDQGTSSIPVSLPATQGNMDLLGNMDNICKARRHIQSRRAYLQCGAIGKECILLTESVSLQSGIAASVLLRESEMYNKFSKRSLKDIFASEKYVMTKNGAHPEDLYHANPGFDRGLVDFAIFPVASDKDNDGHVSVINKYSGDKFVSAARQETINKETISVPDGYGVAPFIFLHALIRMTFTLSEYKVIENVFETDIVLRSIVVVHNCADACCAVGYSSASWGFEYIDLVPDMTAGELIVYLRDTYGAITTSDADGIRIRLLRDIIKQEPELDLTQYERSGRIISYPGPSHLVRSIDTGIDSAEPAAESLEELKASYSTVGILSSVNEIRGSGLFYISPLGRYFHKKDSSSSPVMKGTDCFPYTRDVEGDAEELSSDGVFLPMIQYESKYMPYIGNRYHRYVNAGNKSVGDQKMQVCYALLSNGTQAYYSGTSYSYTDTGVRVPLPVQPFVAAYPSLTPEGLSSFWEKYDELLINNAPEIETVLDMPVEMISNIDVCSPKLLAGQKVIIKKFTYEIREGSLNTAVKMTVLALPSYIDAVSLPKVSLQQKIVWERESTLVLDASSIVVETDGLQDYTSLDIPSSKPLYLGQRTKLRQRWSIIFKVSPFRSESGYERRSWEESFVAVNG